MDESKDAPTAFELAQDLAKIAQALRDAVPGDRRKAIEAHNRGDIDFYTPVTEDIDINLVPKSITDRR